MIGLQNVQDFLNPQPGVSLFKPWWERVIDILFVGFFLIVLVSWTHVFNFHHTGVICVHLKKDNFFTDTFELRYIRSRCVLESNVRSIQFYPYILLIQWTLLFGCHVFWVYIPSIKSRFRFFYSIICEILTVEPRFKPFELQEILPKLDFSEENRHKLSLIHEKVSFVALDKSFLSKAYFRKNCLLFFTIFGCAYSIIFWFQHFKFLDSDFECNLPSGHARREFPEIACNASSFLFIYVAMAFCAIILLLLFILVSYALIWHINFRWRLKKSDGMIFRELDTEYNGLPGYTDLALIVELFRINSKDGGFKLKMIMFTLTGKYDLLSISPSTPLTQATCKIATFSYCQELYMLKFMANELGLEFHDIPQSKKILFDSLENIRNKEFPSSFSIFVNIKNEIFDEIERNILFYSEIVQKHYCRYSDHLFHSKLPSSDYLKETIKQIDLGIEWPNHLILMAASNLLGLCFVLLTIHSPSFDDPLSTDIFTPIKLKKPNPIILAFVKPCYYYSVYESGDPDDIKKENKANYVYRRVYRNNLRQMAIRSISSCQLYESSKPEGFFHF